MTSVAEAEGVGAVDRGRGVRIVLSGRYVFRLAVLVGLYSGSARLGYALEFSGPVAAIVWLPVGVAVAGLSLYGLELLPGALVGDLLANQYTTVPLAAAIGQTTGNMLEVVSTDSLVKVARTWWLGDFCGALQRVPLAIAWHPFPKRFLSRRAALEGA